MKTFVTHTFYFNSMQFELVNFLLKIHRKLAVYTQIASSKNVTIDNNYKKCFLSIILEWFLMDHVTQVLSDGCWKFWFTATGINYILKVITMEIIYFRLIFHNVTYSWVLIQMSRFDSLFLLHSVNIVLIQKLIIYFFKWTVNNISLQLVNS